MLGIIELSNILPNPLVEENPIYLKTAVPIVIIRINQIMLRIENVIVTILAQFSFLHNPFPMKKNNAEKPPEKIIATVNPNIDSSWFGI